jgi:hypothetical protein
MSTEAQQQPVRRIYSSALSANIDFVFELAPGEPIPSYDDLVAELKANCPRIKDIRWTVAMTSDIHFCDEDCPHYGQPIPRS